MFHPREYHQFTEAPLLFKLFLERDQIERKKKEDYLGRSSKIGKINNEIG